MVIEFELKLDTDGFFTLNCGDGDTTIMPIPFDVALHLAVRKANETGKEVHLEQDGRMVGRVIPVRSKM